MLSDSNRRATKARIPGVLCVLFLCGILTAGLWPFHRPTNAVARLADANGLRFGHRGTILSSGPFQTTASQEGCSLEIWLQPRLMDGSGVVLAFYTPRNSRQFFLRQYFDGLVMESESLKTQNYVDVGNVFRRGKPSFITITSGMREGAVYADGVLAGSRPRFRLSSQAFTGQLVVGTSAVSHHSWSGQLRGLAIYNRELTTAQVGQHYAAWTGTGRPTIAQQERNVALYLFDEHAGNVVHDAAGSGNNLYIPDRFLIVHPTLLGSPWKDYRLNWSYWKDVLINIIGFIPLGFVFHAYLCSQRQTTQAAFITMIFGVTVSLTIEILQVYLPTRDSDWTDVITNTLGTCVGVLLYRWEAVHRLSGYRLGRGLGRAIL